MKPKPASEPQVGSQRMTVHFRLHTHTHTHRHASLSSVLATNKLPVQVFIESAESVGLRRKL